MRDIVRLWSHKVVSVRMCCAFYLERLALKISVLIYVHIKALWYIFKYTKFVLTSL